MATTKKARLRQMKRRAGTAVRFELVARARRAPIEVDTVFYESFSGNGMLCNPEAIFRALLATEDMQHLHHVWALREPAQFSGAFAEFADDPRVSFVELNSVEYHARMATAKYLINNATFPPIFGKRDGQIYLNTWHGTPLKAMGYDIADGALDTRNIVRNFVNADYLLAPNDTTAEMYLSSYRMANVFRGALLQVGTPRIDRQFVDGAERRRLRARLRSYGLDVRDDQKLVVYAPTWKGSFHAPTNDIRQLRARITGLREQLGGDGHAVVLKVHQQVHKHAAADGQLRRSLVPNEMPANDVLAAADIVITDYSSIFVDFLATGRPVLFYTPDLEDYESMRGLNLPVAEWPGPVCRELGELARRINKVGTGEADDPQVSHAAAYAAAQERYTALEHGDACARVIDIVFRGRADDEGVRRGFKDDRVSILIHLGAMLNNGISSSALSLLDNLDHERFDVTATFDYVGTPDRLRIMSLINPNVRVLPRLGGMNGAKLPVRALLAVEKQSAQEHRDAVVRHRDLLHDEWVRCYGASRFDHIVEFGGYNPFWVKLLSTREHGSLSLWMHNEMLAELNSSGKHPRHRANIEGVLAMLGEVDHIVSVSAVLAELNSAQLHDRAAPEKFTFARNTINFLRVLHLAYGITRRDDAGLATACQVSSAQLGGGSAPTVLSPAQLRESVAALLDVHGIAEVDDEVTRREVALAVLPPAFGVRTFVTVGRLSPEKNPVRLIRAFDLVHQEDPDTRLVIVGAGPLEPQLAALITELGLTAAVTLAGFQANPYAVLAGCDCFVLSSDYEGQPMVLLEAMILGLPIVSTAFGSVRGALPAGAGLVVGRDVPALAEGMRAFLRGEVPSPSFDAARYNRDAMQEFYRAIGCD